MHFIHFDFDLSFFFFFPLYVLFLQDILPFCDSCALFAAFLCFLTEQKFVMTVRLVDSIDVARWWLAGIKYSAG